MVRSSALSFKALHFKRFMSGFLALSPIIYCFALSALTSTVSGCATEQAAMQQADFHQMRFRRAVSDAERSGATAEGGRIQILRERDEAFTQLQSEEGHLTEARSARSEATSKIHQHKLLKP